MGLFRHKQLFCILCKKNITYKQKPKREWNLEGFLCGDCYVDKMGEQYNVSQIDERLQEIDKQNKTNLGGNNKIKAEKSPRSIKWNYYFGIWLLIMSPISIISGLATNNTIGWTLGIVFLVIGVIQYPKNKKAMDKLSENKDNVTEKENSPLAVLQMRLAKGEITKEEFDKIKDDLI